MTTVHIEDSTPEGRFLLDLIRNRKSATIEPKESETWAKVVAAGAVPLDDFNARFEYEIEKPTNSNARHHRFCHGIVQTVRAYRLFQK